MDQQKKKNKCFFGFTKNLLKIFFFFTDGEKNVARKIILAKPLFTPVLRS